MKLTIECAPVRTMLGKRVGNQWQGTIVGTGYSVTGPKEEIESKLTEVLARESEFQLTRRYLRVTGATFCLYYAGGWAYDIVRDDNPNQPSTCLMASCTTYMGALGSMTSHAKQWEQCQVQTAETVNP